MITLRRPTGGPPPVMPQAQSLGQAMVAGKRGHVLLAQVEITLGQGR